MNSVDIILGALQTSSDVMFDSAAVSNTNMNSPAWIELRGIVCNLVHKNEWVKSREVLDRVYRYFRGIGEDKVAKSMRRKAGQIIPFLVEERFLEIKVDDYCSKPSSNMARSFHASYKRTDRAFTEALGSIVPDPASMEFLNSLWPITPPSNYSSKVYAIAPNIWHTEIPDVSTYLSPEELETEQ